jgi:uncharacterized protein with ParB-like and HNH nuclease domain
MSCQFSKGTILGTKKHWNDLWNDILGLWEEEGLSKEHFIGSIVCMSAEHVPYKVPQYVIIDGQQRLTTIAILLSVLRDIAKEKNITELTSEIQEKYLIDKFRKGLERHKIISRSKDRQFLSGLIDETVPAGESSIVEAYSYFKDRIVKLLENQDEPRPVLEKLREIITKQLPLVMITLTSDEENPFAIFETLNERGLPLEESDLIRNFVFMQLPLEEQDRFDEELWMPFESMFDSKAGFMTAFYRDHLMSYGKYVKISEIYAHFKKHVKDKQQTPQELATELKRYAGFYLTFHRPEISPDKRITETLKRINMLDISTAYPLLLYLFDRFDVGAISLDDFLASLHALESFALRRSICGESTRPYSRWFPMAVRDIKTNVERGQDTILSSLLNFLHNKGWPDDEKFKEALLTFPLYWRERQKCRLILEELEKSYKHKEPVNLTISNIQIEHIMPQTLSEEWKTMLGEEWQRIHETYLHTIGNLTLSGYNLELYNRPYPDKKTRLAQSNLELNRYFANVDVWNESAIVARGRKLVEEVTKIWACPSLQ